MIVEYDTNTDMLYLRLSEGEHTLINKRVSEDIVLDIGENDKIIGIEILDASQHVTLKDLLPVQYKLPKAG